MGGDTGLAVAWTVITFIPFLIGQLAFIYWVFRSFQLSKKFAKYLKSLLWLNWAGIVAFWLTVTFDWIEILRNLIVGTDFTTRLEEPDLQFPFMVAMLGYISGKWIVYFVLYLRLKYTLHKSAYSYDESVYKKIRIAIVAEIIITILATGMFIAADGGIIITIGLIFAFFFIILDIGIPVTLNIMFIKKTYQIGKVYFRIVSMTSRSNSPPRASTTNTAELGNELRPSNGPKAAERAASISVSDAGGKTHKMDSSKTDTELALEVQQTNGSEAGNGGREATVSGNGGADNGDNGAQTNNDDNNKSGNISAESEKDLSELFDAISKVAVLAVMITISSFLFFIGFILGSVNDPLEPFVYLSRDVDAAVNIVCLVLAFEFARKYFKLFCGAFQNCCKKNIEQKVEAINA